MTATAPCRSSLRTAGAPGQKILFLETTDFCVESHLAGQLAALREAGFRPVVATRDTGILDRVRAAESVPAYDLLIERKPNVIRDVLGFIRTLRRIRDEKPDLVVYGTPKAALFGALASRIVRVPRRVFFLYGLRAETMSGIGRALVLLSERLVVALSTDSLAVGAGVRHRAAELGIDTSRMHVVGRGSANGVDVAHFETAGRDTTRRRDLRAELGIDGATTVIGFVGRVTADKGIESLVEAAAELRQRGLLIHLILVGPDEGIDQLSALTQAVLTQSWVTIVGQVPDTADLYNAFDIFCLPSRREGLPTVVLEACAAGVPVVVSDATGMADAVDGGRVGVMTPVDDTPALTRALSEVIADPTGARRQAALASTFVRREFDSSVVRHSLVNYYAHLLGHG